MSHKNCTRPDGNKGCIDCVAYGEQMAEERIIKLLEKECSTFHSYSCDCTEQIALIKGERSKEEQIADLMWLSEQQLIAENKGEGEKQTGKEFDYFETPLEGENK